MTDLVNEDVSHDVPHRMSPRRCVRGNRLAIDKHLIGQHLHLERALLGQVYPVVQAQQLVGVGKMQCRHEFRRSERFGANRQILAGLTVLRRQLFEGLLDHPVENFFTESHAIPIFAKWKPLNAYLWHRAATPLAASRRYEQWIVGLRCADDAPQDDLLKFGT